MSEGGKGRNDGLVDSFNADRKGKPSLSCGKRKPMSLPLPRHRMANTRKKMNDHQSQGKSISLLTRIGKEERERRASSLGVSPLFERGRGEGED